MKESIGFSGRKHTKETKEIISKKLKGIPKLFMRRRIILKCKQCGKEFETTPIHKDRKYCSKRCYGDSKIKIKICENCGDEFTGINNKFCSRKCKSEYNTIINSSESVCINCGDKFRHINSRNAKFCSVECKNEYQVGENNPAYINGQSLCEYPKEFNDELKEYIREKYLFRCQICGKLQSECNRKLSVHHIDYDKDNCSEENLIPLCLRCHALTNTNREYWEDLFINKNI